MTENDEGFVVVNTKTGEMTTDYLGRPLIYADERSANAALLSMNPRDRKNHFVDMYFDESVELSEMVVENEKAIKELSPAAQKFIMDLRRKKKAQIEKGTYSITVFFETLQVQDDSDGSWFDFTEAVVRGMAKQRSGWIAKVVKRFDYEGRKFRDKDHVVLFGKDVKAEKKKGWTAPELISEGSKMDIKNIIKSIVEKKLEKDSDDPCWDGYVQLGMKKKGGKEVPNCVPKESVDDDFMRDQGGSGNVAARGTVKKNKGYNRWWAKNRAGTMKIFDSEKKANRFSMTNESVELDEAKNNLVARYMNKSGTNVLYFEIWERPNGNMYSVIKNQRGLNIAASAIDLKSSHAEAKRNVERAVMFYDQDGDSGALRHLNSLLPGWKKAPLDEATELLEKVEISHDRYLRSHGKKARGRGMWMFTSKGMGEPKSDEIVTVNGSLTTAAKEAAKKLDVKRVYVMESIELKENFKVGDRVRNPYKDDMYGGAKRFGKVTDVRGSGKRLVVSVDWGSGSIDYLPNSGDKMDQLVVESVELTEDVHNDLNDAIFDFQRKLMRMKSKLDPSIKKEIEKIDRDLDELRAGPLHKIRPGR